MHSGNSAKSVRKNLGGDVKSMLLYQSLKHGIKSQNWLNDF
jgi:hypothetical protein